MSTNYKSLYRSRDKRMIAGVCGGLGDFFGIDPTLIRLFFVFGAFFLGIPGAFALAYLVLMIVVPEEPAGVVSPSPVETEPPVIESGPEASADVPPTDAV